MDYDTLDGTRIQDKLVAGWLGKLDCATRARENWKTMADECMMFYGHSAAAMWNDDYKRKFWSGVSPPRFRVTINKAFELVAVMGPSLLWDVPHRTVASKKRAQIPEEIFQLDQEMAASAEFFQQQWQQDHVSDKAVSWMMETWLNYTSREQPGGGLHQHSALAVVDALIKGRGVLVTRPFQFPGSERTLTGSFRLPPEDLFIDPDALTIDDAKWIAIRHIDPTWEVERRFKDYGLKPGSLKNKATMESTWGFGERLGNSQDAALRRAAGQTNDLIVWYEVYSKTGCGSRMSGMNRIVSQEMEKQVGDYAFLAITSNCPYPLNCPDTALSREPAERISERFKWPVEYWRDNAWPVECLDFYPNVDSEAPDRAWPMPLLSSAMGELKLLNVLIPFLINRVWMSSRDFFVIAGHAIEDYREHIESGKDLSIIPTAPGNEDVRKSVTILQQPETRADLWRIVDFVLEMFEKRTGLVDYLYGKNEGGTQDRTAETTIARKEAAGIRGDDMQKKVVGWQSRVAIKEAQCTGFMVEGTDVEPLLGAGGRYLWDRYVKGDSESIVRQFDYTVAAASVRRPNRDRDVANFQQFSQFLMSFFQEYAGQTGNFEVINSLIEKWGELHDMNVEDLLLPPPQPDPQQEQMQQQQFQLESAKLQADVEKAQAGAEKAQIDAQAKLTQTQMEMQAGQMEVQGKQVESALKRAEQQQDMAFDQQRFQQETAQSRADQLLDLLFKRQTHSLDLDQQEEQFEQKMAQERTMARIKQAKAKAPSEGPRR